MTPEQKFILSCRQTAGAAARLKDWLEHNSSLLGLAQGAVVEEIATLSGEISPLATAAETAPQVAIVGTAGGAKADLVYALLNLKGPTQVAEFGQRPLDEATIRALLPGDGQAMASAVVRYTAAELPPIPRGFPIHLGLLSMGDAAAILAGCAVVSPPNDGRLAGAERIDALFAGIADRLSPQALPGLSERDVTELKEILAARWPGDPALSLLAAGGYWQRFAEIAAHMSDRDRRRVLALLWGEASAPTALFDRLCDGLDKLGQGAEAYCPTDALLGKDKQSGWLIRHPRSIGEAATISSIAPEAGPMVSMMNRYGQTVDIERAVAAALIGDIRVHLAASRLNDMATVEIADFPVPPMITSFAPAAPGQAPGEREFAVVAAHYARLKAIHLVERACRRRDLTGLVAVVDPAIEDDTFTSTIAEFVETAQGQTASARERVRRSLFVAAPLGSETAAGGGGQVSSGRAEAVAAFVRDVLGEGQEWPHAWTPGRAFGEAIYFQAVQDARPRAAAGQASVPVRAASVVPAGLAQLADANVSHLVRTLGQSADTAAKQFQLHQALLAVRRRIRHAVLRHHASNDPSALALWRRGAAIVVQDRLQLVRQAGRIGLLHRALVPAEDDIAAAITAARAGQRSLVPSPARWGLEAQNDDGPGAPGPAAADGRDVARMADAAVAHWLATMRRAARCRGLCRNLRIEPAVMASLVDELQIGAIRCGVAGEIANAYLGAPARTSRTQAGRDYDLIRLSAYATRIIAAYIEALSPPLGRGNIIQNIVRQPSNDLEVAEALPGGYGSSTTRPAAAAVARRGGKPLRQPWESSFVKLVEDNITSAQTMAGRGDKDRELGELVQLFAPGPFEVEQ